MTLFGRVLLTVLVTLGSCSRLEAQSSGDPAVSVVSVRPFLLFSQQRFAARETFEAVFGGSSHPFVGGGAQVTFGPHVFADIAISRFRKSGERSFHHEGESFQLGIPLTVSVTPIELIGGVRFPIGVTRAIVPYVGGGVGSFKYRETADFAADGDDVELRKAGYLVVVGTEFRLHRWVAASADVQYARVPDILGQGGMSQQLGEDDLGGVAARFRVMIGR